MIFDKFRQIAERFTRPRKVGRSKYLPHFGARQKARLRRQILLGQLEMAGSQEAYQRFSEAELRALVLGRAA